MEFRVSLLLPIAFNLLTEHFSTLDHLPGPVLLAQIMKLGSHKLEEIKKEETHLIEENCAIVEQTQNLAITNYKAFIQTSECSREIVTDFRDVERKLDHLIDNLLHLTGQCENFINRSHEINTSRRLNSLTLRRNVQLLEILELPQLMDTCIHQGKYEEALELAAYVQRLGQKHGGITVMKVRALISAISRRSHAVSIFRTLSRQLKAPGIQCCHSCWHSSALICPYRSAFKSSVISGACKRFYPPNLS